MAHCLVQVNGQWHCRSEQANDESRELFVARLIITSSSQARRCNGVFTLRYARHAFGGNSPSRVYSQSRLSQRLSGRLMLPLTMPDKTSFNNVPMTCSLS